MIDPRQEGILVRNRHHDGLDDKTSEVEGYRVAGAFTYVTFSSGKTYRYSSDRVLILRRPVPVPFMSQDTFSVRGKVLEAVTEVLRFESLHGTWWRVFHKGDAGLGYETCREAEITVSQPSEEEIRARAVLDYWRDVASRLKEDDPLRRQYRNFTGIPKGSALDALLQRRPLDLADQVQHHPILPFSSNISQREALVKGLSHRISVIDGPPGTGKTETILNLVANIVAVPGQRVGIVSFNNAAVENVRDKLAAEGYGHIVADLGRKEKIAEFFASQEARNAAVERFVEVPPVEAPPAEYLVELDSRLQALQSTARQLAQWQQQLDAYQLERRHFLLHPDAPGLPALEGVPLPRVPSARILEFLAETTFMPVESGALRKLFRRLRLRLRFGPLGRVDPHNTDVVLRLQGAYYDNKIKELEEHIGQAKQLLAHQDYGRLEKEYRLASRQTLKVSLHRRYAQMRRRIHSEATYKSDFAAFTADYPVILSTCHSLRRNVPTGQLLDFLIIDEASQVDLLAAGLALSRTRHVIVVGDLQQLQHIADESASRNSIKAPSASVDYKKHNILSSIIEQLGDGLPRTMLREHYRCDPAIIEFCNRKFYGGRLVPYTSSGSEGPPLVVVRTAEGNHMRQHNSGGRTNQREADVIAQEVLGRFCSGFSNDQIGVVTPYRRQVDKVAEALIRSIQADTVHKFQGRQKDVIIMSTVLDETISGHLGVSFVDDPHLVNVAVSRAVKRFVLVTNNDMLPKSRHLRDLVHFIRYRSPEDGVFDSNVVSVFDLLYRDYSALLRPLAARLRRGSTFTSENIIWTLLLEVLEEEPFSDLAVAPQVMLKNLLRDTTALTSAQASFVENRASLDFVVYNRVTNLPVLVVEVDGFAFHENNPAQQVRDDLKDAICRAQGLRLLRLPTTGSGEETRLRSALSAAMA